jgi:hypothetical protein
MDELRRRIEGARYSLVLQDYETVRYMGARGNFSVTKEPPPGRGFLVKAVSASLVQLALPAVDGKDGRSAPEQLDEMVLALQEAYPVRAKWSYFAEDLAALDTALKGEGGEAAPAEPTAVNEPPQDILANLNALMAEQAGLAQQMAAEIPDAANFASVEIPERENGAGDSPAGGDGAANGSAPAEPAGETPAPATGD